MSIGENLKIFIKVKVFNFKEQINTIKKYYKKKKLAGIDIALSLIAFFINPYRVSKRYISKNKMDEDIHVYGETPLSTFEKIISECNLSQDHKFLELGSGRGKCSFWLSQEIGCEVTAIEQISFFYKTASFLARLFKIKKLNFICGDMLSDDFTFAGFDFIYMFGSSWKDDDILKLINKIKKEKKLRIITISYPLSDYDNCFKTLKTVEVSFPWGNTLCFFNRVVF